MLEPATPTVYSNVKNNVFTFELRIRCFYTSATLYADNTEEPTLEQAQAESDRTIAVLRYLDREANRFGGEIQDKLEDLERKIDDFAKKEYAENNLSQESKDALAASTLFNKLDDSIGKKYEQEDSLEANEAPEN